MPQWVRSNSLDERRRRPGGTTRGVPHGPDDRELPPDLDVGTRRSGCGRASAVGLPSWGCSRPLEAPTRPLPARRRDARCTLPERGIAVTDAAPVLGLLAGRWEWPARCPTCDTLRRTTVPHRGSWLIWSVLEVVALEAQRADGAQWSMLPLLTQAIGTCLVFGLSIRLGSGRLTRVDLSLIALAGVGVAGWLAVDEPVIATTCVIVADLVAVLMMMPKAWCDPHSETLSTFALAAGSGVLTSGAVGSLSVSLLAYPVYFAAVNAAVAGVISHRRRALERAAASPVSGSGALDGWSVDGTVLASLGGLRPVLGSDAPDGQHRDESAGDKEPCTDDHGDLKAVLERVRDAGSRHRRCPRRPAGWQPRAARPPERRHC